eukprot:6206705-Pleurochrysis_carterae.AAC.1
MALSMEKESLGSPSMFHARIFTASPNVVVSENLSEHGTFCSEMALIQSTTTRSRNVCVKGPM